MKWQVKGASSKTGEDIKVVLEAPDRAAAEDIAAKGHILVESISPLESSKPMAVDYAPSAPSSGNRLGHAIGRGIRGAVGLSSAPTDIEKERFKIARSAMRSVGALRRQSLGFMIVGLILSAIGAVVFVLAAVGWVLATSPIARADIELTILYGLATTLVGSLLRAGASFMRLFAEFGARNFINEDVTLGGG